ncbi:CHAT domain-containing protein [Qipengyuania flava]|uniref:CHAT domain-containing protein n=1 Tax=Qipengyuania flava TaxID=192812 RepID=UPI001C630FB8|nr:CHAT domain-containing protein [Qipengyuania flava]QYJ06884.1 CHAT domain-containing protein [Qipengyuania flava]
MSSKILTSLAAFGAAAAVTLAPSQSLVAQPSGERPISYSDSFPIGGNGLCEAQIMPPKAGTGLFDRGYSIVCRDAAAPVGTLWVLRGASDSDLPARFLPAAQCQAGEGSVAPQALSDGTSLACSDTETGTRRVLVGGTVSGRLYAGEAIEAYSDAVRLGLASLVADSPVAGDVEIPLTETGDAAAFARAQARALSADAVIAEAYRRSNSGAFAEAAEFFAETAASAEGSNATEALLNAALLQSNLGNYAEAERGFATVRSQVAGDAVLSRMLRNYEALDALNLGAPQVALDRLNQPLPPSANSRSALEGLEISDALAARLSAEQPSALDTIGGLTPLERADLLDGQTSYLKATALRLLGRDAEARTQLAEADRVLASVRNGTVRSILWLRAQVLSELADLAERRGDMAAAEGYHNEAVTLLGANYPGSPALLSSRAQLAGFLARTDRRDAALETYRSLVDEAGDKPAPALRRLLVPYFNLLTESGAAADGAAGDLFLASQLLQRPGLAQTQAVLARELSGGSDEASQLFRKAVNVGRSVERMRNQVSLLEGEAAANPLIAEQLAAKRDALAKLEAQQLTIQNQLGEYPRFRAVSDSRVALSALQETLEPGEGYLKLVALDGATYAVFATRETARAYRTGIDPDTLEAEVAALRATIAYVENGQTLTFPFDIERSRALYLALFEPVDAELKALRHLVFEPDGAMLKLPANLLVADEESVERYAERLASGGDEYDFTGTNWLGRNVQITTTVSPSAFREVRRAPGSSATQEYIGFGNNTPLGEDRGTLGTRSALSGGSDCLWAPAVWDYPIAPDELYTAARSLGAAASDDRILTGDTFTDTAVLGMEDLDDYRILHFATHGLVTAPQPECPPRPALLTSFGGDQSDGLLSFAEIFDLKLDADLVILSACDTAGAATRGASREAGVSGGGFALDGLVRAFVGAGGRTVIASHWPVPDDFNATNRLIDGFFAAGQGTDLGEAMRASQIALMDDADTSHPFYWAAFAIVGDGAAELRK